MTTRRVNAIKVTAGLILLSLLQVGVQVGFAEPNSPTNPLPIPQQFIARLTTRNNQPITVNGNSATTGASIVTGATIETGADQAATINLGPLGTLDIAPNTKLVLSYDERGNVKVNLVTGCAILTARKKTTGEVATEQGTAAKTDPAKGGILDICFPVGAVAPIIGQGAAASAGAGAGAAGAAGAAAAGGGGLLGIGLPATLAIATAVTGAALSPIGFQTNPSGSQ